MDWLRQTNDSADVIVVFGGWAIGPACLSHLTGAQDVIFVSDYSGLTTGLPDLGGYTSRTLLAWSFGVAAFAHWQAVHEARFDRHVAINGSHTPVHARTGIPPRVFRHTADHLSVPSFQDFLTHSFNAPQPVQIVDVAQCRAELQAVEQRGAAPPCRWDRVWISTRDRIFPSQNLERAWRGEADRICRIDAAHVPFAAWSAWEEIWQ